MFDDPKKELKRLEKQLLEEEDGSWLDNELSEVKAMLGDSGQQDLDATRIYRDPGAVPVRNYANGYGQVPAQSGEYDEYGDSAYAADPREVAPREKGVGGLVLLALLELLGIVGIIGYWLLMIG